MWMVLLVFIVVQNLFLYITYEPKQSTEPQRRFGVLASEIVEKNLPDLVCSSQDNNAHIVFKHGHYELLPDEYNSQNVIIYNLDDNGAPVFDGTMFTTRRCSIRGDVSFLTKTEKTEKPKEQK